MALRRSQQKTMHFLIDIKINRGISFRDTLMDQVHSQALGDFKMEISSVSKKEKTPET